MYDTIAAIHSLNASLDDRLFQGGSITEDFESGRASARLWRNPTEGSYAPRVTYWPAGPSIKVEFSIPKLIGITNPTQDEAMVAIETVDVWLKDKFGPLPPLLRWRCLRIDYAWTFDVDPAIYLQVVQHLQVRTMKRHGYRGEGVVWKQGSRWVKFYDKRIDGQPGLRFEVSNYRDSIRYMNDVWFMGDRSVATMLHPGRALYVMAYIWTLLGLDVDSYSDAVGTLHQLRNTYGASVASAYYHLMLLREYNREAIKLGLTNSSSFATWKKRLNDDGFVAIINDDVIEQQSTIEALSLPVKELIEQARNLEVADRPQVKGEGEKILVILGVPGARDLEILEREHVRYGVLSSP